jgi:diguanylate cyclase (GGDEF)-like protein
VKTDTRPTDAGAAAGERGRRCVLAALSLLAVLPLPVAAFTLGVYADPRAEAGSVAQHFVSSQALLVCGALVVSAVGGFLIWSAAMPLAHTADAGERPSHLDETLAARLEDSAPLKNSFTRMLATIERQTEEINQFAQRLDSAYQELESAHVRLQEVTFTDEVTRLYNRRFFSIRVEEELARHRRFGHPFSVVLLDLDGFKAVNDRLGHLAGDETLRGVAEVLLKNSRAIDVVSRYGGDEFAVLLPETSPDGAAPYAERVRDVLAGYSFSHGRQITASFGFASLPVDVAAADELIRAADEALYAAKRSGKNCVAAYHAVGVRQLEHHEVPVA